MADQSLTLDAVLSFDHVAQHVAPAESREVIREALGLAQDLLVGDHPNPVELLRRLRVLVGEDSIGLHAVMATRFEAPPSSG